jgi:hypothetical protein
MEAKLRLEVFQKKEVKPLQQKYGKSKMIDQAF